MESRYRDLRTVGERKLIHAGKDLRSGGVGIVVSE